MCEMGRTASTILGILVAIISGVISDMTGWFWWQPCVIVVLIALNIWKKYFRKND